MTLLQPWLLFTSEMFSPWMSKFTDSTLSRSDGVLGFEAGGGGGGASPFSRPKENKTLVSISALLIGGAAPFYHC